MVLGASWPSPEVTMPCIPAWPWSFLVSIRTEAVRYSSSHQFCRGFEQQDIAIAIVVWHLLLGARGAAVLTIRCFSSCWLVAIYVCILPTPPERCQDTSDPTLFLPNSSGRRFAIRSGRIDALFFSPRCDHRQKPEAEAASEFESTALCWAGNELSKSLHYATSAFSET